MLRSLVALLTILLAAPAYAGGGVGDGSFRGGGPHGGGAFRGGGLHGFAFHRGIGRSHALLGLYGYGYNCAYGFDCGAYDFGYGYGGYGYGYGYGGGPGNVVSSGGAGPGVGSGGGYVPDPVGADIPPVIFPKSCWVRRAGYDPTGAYLGQVLIDLCRPSDSVTVNRADARAKPPNAGKGTGEPAPAERPGASQPTP